MREGRNGGKLKSGNTVNVGRPKKIPEINQLLANVLGADKNGKTAAEEILQKLVDLAKKGNVRAAEVLLARGYGLPTQNMVVDGDMKITFTRE